jgi:serine/threonine-protein kinase RsbW
MSSSNTKSLVLSSKFEEMNRLEPFVDNLKKWAGFSEEDSNRIMLTLSEAVNNAIMHGNKQDPRKQVFIQTTWNKEEGTLQISIEDEGDGFNPEEVPNPLKDENLLNEGGRGIYLIKQYADDIQFSENGTKVTITFHLEEN